MDDVVLESYLSVSVTQYNAPRSAYEVLLTRCLATGMFMASAQLGEQLPSKTFKSVFSWPASMLIEQRH